MAEDKEIQRRKRKPSVNVRDLKKVIDMMRKADLSELDIEQEGLTLRLRRGAEPVIQMAAAPIMPPAAPAAPAAPVASGAPAPAAPASEAVEEEGIVVTAPMVGTFYLAGSPEADPFVKTGNSVAVGDTICVIEAMKLMNEIKAEVAGTITKILIENAQPVEYGQPLFVVKPA